MWRCMYNETFLTGDYVIDAVIDLKWYMLSKLKYHSFFGGGGLKSHYKSCNNTSTMRHSWWEIISLMLLLIRDDISFQNSSITAFLVGVVWKAVLCHGTTQVQWDIPDGRLCHWLCYWSEMVSEFKSFKSLECGD